MHKTIVSKGYLLTGIIIGGALAGLQYWHIHSHMAFLWLGIFGLMFVLGLSYTTHYGQLLCCAILTSFLASIPCVWLINARLPYFSPVLLAGINAYALNAFYLHFLQHRFHVSYPALFHATWDTFIRLCVTCFFTFLCCLILGLASALFSLVHIDFLQTLLSKMWFIYWINAIFIGLGVEITTRKTQVIDHVRDIFLMICQFLLIPLSLIGLLFIILLLITHSLAFNQSYFATLAFLSLFLVNTAYEPNKNSAIDAGIRRRLMTLFLMVTPLFSLLALYAVFFKEGNNILQQGINAANFPYALNLLLLFAYNLAYAWIALLRQPVWMKSLEKANIVLAFVLIGLTLLTTNPAFLRLLPTPKNHYYAVQRPSFSEENTTLIDTFTKAGFVWEKQNHNTLPKKALVLGYNASPLYFCRPTTNSNTGGVLNNHVCHYVENNTLQKTRDFSVLSGPSTLLTWQPWKPISDKQFSLIILSNIKNPVSICRLIYNNKIVIGTSQDIHCRFIADRKIIEENSGIEFLSIKKAPNLST